MTLKNEHEILNLAENHGLYLRPETLTINESGMDFQVGFAKDENGLSWVLRKPRRRDILKRAEYEGRALELLKKELPVAVPDWQVNSQDLIAYPRVVGTPLAVIDLEIMNYAWHVEPDSIKDVYVRSLAKVMADLHGVDKNRVADAGIEVLKPSEARKSMMEKMEQTKREIGVSEELWVRWQKWIEEDSYWPEHSALIHGDLHPAHILIDEEQQVTGLLDWTEVKVTDPAMDFIVHYMIFGKSGTETLLKHYENAGGRVWPRMLEHIAEHQAAYPVSVAMFALQTGEDGHMDMARNALGLNK
ncbi:macrolide 2'-phosphotransferase [Alkalihalobacillus sp. TS-13]|uniref:macrolide 2'-phosphotransferase n=1 Tax=Alkalihalobacillus sp. TS-13 TaxID=2842455 RepID=UPI001C881883|nr:macrolide 2'-phosphotransferase [Alkalihalobacillus sp. TS-13]